MTTFASRATGSSRSLITRCERVQQLSLYEVLASTTAGTRRTVSDPHSAAFLIEVLHSRDALVDGLGITARDRESPVVFIHDERILRPVFWAASRISAASSARVMVRISIASKPTSRPIANRSA